MRLAITVLFSFFIAAAANAEVVTKSVAYEYSGAALKGMIAYDSAQKGKRPGVVVVHEFWGLNDYARSRTKQLAELGYVALAADMYGDGRSTDHPKEASAMMSEIKENLPAWLGRANAAISVLKKDPNVDPEKIAIIGYCFGGATALQVAYSGAQVRAAVSFHGALSLPDSMDNVKASILVLHGGDDSFIPKETVSNLDKLLNDGKGKHKMVIYPGAVHSFTVPGAENRGMDGVRYNPEADKSSWQEMIQLFQRVFKS